jgi:maleate isomerase
MVGSVSRVKPALLAKVAHQQIKRQIYRLVLCLYSCQPSATSIAETSIKQVMNAVRECDGDDVDAIIQCGTNLSTVDLFPTLEHYLEKPLIPINVGCIWHALRACGINDKITSKGRLLEEF